MIGRIVGSVVALALVAFMSLGVFRAYQGASVAYYCDGLTRGVAVMHPFGELIDDQMFSKAVVQCIEERLYAHPRVSQWTRGSVGG